MAIEPWRRQNVETALDSLRFTIRNEERKIAERECELNANSGTKWHLSLSATHLYLLNAVSFLEATLMDEPDNYELMKELPDPFIAEFEGQTRRCFRAEHVNIGRGWLLRIEGINRGISETEISNPRE